VTRSPQGEFRAGTRLLQLAGKALGDEFVVQQAQQSVSELVAATGESSYLSVRGVDDTAVYLFQLEGTRSLRHRSWIGKSVPLGPTAAGAALLGDVPESGFVVRRATLESGVTAVAAPVRGSHGGIVAALSVVGASFRLDDEELSRIGDLLVSKSKVVSTRLGYQTAVAAPS